MQDPSSPRVIREPPRVGIVTPSFEMADLLPATIQSVLTQDYPYVDYLVMDGGSRDGTVDLLERYGPRVRWISEPDGGQAHAVNRGFERTSGEIFAFLNADDTLRPGALTRAVDAFARRPGIGAVYGRADYVDPEGALIMPYPTEPFDRGRLAHRCFICQPATFVSRAAWAACGGLDERLHFALDYDLWIRMSERFTLVHLDEPLATFRMHPRNKTLTSRAAHYRESIEVVRRHYGYVPPIWYAGYAAHLVDGADQFHEHSRYGRRARALALAIALRDHPGRPARVMRDWQTDGLADLFPDGWMSKAHITRRDVPPEAVVLAVAGRHHAGVRRPLVLSVSVDGAIVGRRAVRHRGPFELRLPIPPEARGRRCEVELRSLWTWRPNLEGDERRLSCLIDSVNFR